MDPSENVPLASVETAGMFHDGLTEALDTPWCPAVSTTLPETDHLFAGVGEGSVGEAPEEDPPPHADAQRIAAAAEARRRGNLRTVTGGMASTTPGMRARSMRWPIHKASSGFFTSWRDVAQGRAETAELWWAVAA